MSRRIATIAVAVFAMGVACSRGESPPVPVPQEREAPVPQGASAPMLVSVSPAEGEVLPPGAAELRLVFDRDMDQGGYSLTRGATALPPFAGEPRWVSARELRLAMVLESGMTYELGLNGAGRRGFRDLAGQAVAPHVVRFTTLPLDAARAAQATAELREALTTRYVWAARLDVPKLFAAHGAALEAAPSSRAFATAAMPLLAAAADAHLWLDVGGQRLPTFNPAITPNVDPARLEPLVRRRSQPDPCLTAGWLADDVAYLAITSLDRKRCVGLPRAFGDALGALGAVRAVVIDVRGNQGGDEVLGRGIAGWLVDHTTPYAAHELRATDGTMGPRQVRTFEPAAPDGRFTRPVVVLTGPACMSSCESLLLMLRAAGAKLVGARSRGATGNPQPVALASGVVVHLPSWRAMQLDGKEIERNGIEPDVKVTWGTGAGGDPVVDAAMKMVVKLPPR